MAAETTDMAALYRDALEAIRDALDIPLAAIGGDNDQQRKALMEHRASATVEAVKSVLAFDGHPDLVRRRIENLRTRTSQLPVTYRRYIAEASSHPADCAVCGPGCCSPVVGVHDSCPGPLVGRTVESVR